MICVHWICLVITIFFHLLAWCTEIELNAAELMTTRQSCYRIMKVIIWLRCSTEILILHSNLASLPCEACKIEFILQWFLPHMSEEYKKVSHLLALSWSNRDTVARTSLKMHDTDNDKGDKEQYGFVWKTEDVSPPLAHLARHTDPCCTKIQASDKVTSLKFNLQARVQTTKCSVTFEETSGCKA